MAAQITTPNLDDAYRLLDRLGRGGRPDPSDPIVAPLLENNAAGAFDLLFGCVAEQEGHAAKIADAVADAQHDMDKDAVDAVIAQLADVARYTLRDHGESVAAVPVSACVEALADYWRGSKRVDEFDEHDAARELVEAVESAMRTATSADITESALSAERAAHEDALASERAHHVESLQRCQSEYVAARVALVAERDAAQAEFADLRARLAELAGCSAVPPATSTPRAARRKRSRVRTPEAADRSRS